MANPNIKRLPNGKWECRFDGDEEAVLLAATQEEAERMAEAYLKGDGQVKKRIARGTSNKTGTGLLD